LLSHTQTFNYPSYISSAMTKALRDQGKMYDKLATGFQERNAGVVWTAKVEDFAKVRLGACLYRFSLGCYGADPVVLERRITTPTC
jgi:hypothetical protein